MGTQVLRETVQAGIRDSHKNEPQKLSEPSALAQKCTTQASHRALAWTGCTYCWKTLAGHGKPLQGMHRSAQHTSTSRPRARTAVPEY